MMASDWGPLGDLGSELPQQVSLPAGRSGASLPPCQVTEEDLRANPSLATLLQGLAGHMDASGLSTGLACQLQQVQRELQLQRAAWLRWEVLHRLLQEVLLKADTGSAPLDRKFLETLERCLRLGELRLIVGLGPTPCAASPTLLGLEVSDLQELLPPSQDLALLRECLPLDLEERLQHRALALLSYYWPESDGAGAAERAAQLGMLAEALAAEQRRLREARGRCRDLIGLLERQRAAYGQVLEQCRGLLCRLAQEYRLGTQAKLDQSNAQYLETKCSAMLLKARLEELSILLDTYPAEKVEVHRAIRAELEVAIEQQEQELAQAQELLAAYETLGPDFAALAEEYAELQAQADNRRWALRELAGGSPQ